MSNNTSFSSVEAAFTYLSRRITGFDIDIEFHEPTNRPKVVLSLDTPEVRLAVDPVATNLSDADDNYVITSYEHDTHWLVVYDNSPRPGVRVEEADASARTFAGTSMSFERALERVTAIAATYTDTPAPAATQPTVSKSEPEPEPEPNNILTVGSETATLHFDGASRGNPGDAATGYVLADTDGNTITGGTPIGEVTNNEAEYKALIEGLEVALHHDVTDIEIHGDSKLIVNQVNGDWDCNSTDLKPHRCTVRHLLSAFDAWTLKHVPRDENSGADAAANKALDSATA